MTLLPEHLVEVTLSDMIIGEVAYVVPWALVADANGTCYLRADFRFSKKPFGTQCMKVKRTGRGFEVWIPRGAQYAPSDLFGLSLLPVSRLR